MKTVICLKIQNISFGKKNLYAQADSIQTASHLKEWTQGGVFLPSQIASFAYVLLLTLSLSKQLTPRFQIEVQN